MAAKKAIIHVGANTGQLSKDLDRAKKVVKKASHDMKAQQKKAQAATAALGAQFNTLGAQAAVMGGAPVAAIMTMVNAIKGVGLAAGGGTKAMKLLRLAMVSTGVGALVVAVGSLVAYFTTISDGVDLWRRGMLIVETIVGRIIDGVGFLGKAMVKVFTGDFKGAMDAAKEAMDSFTSLGEGVEQANTLADAREAERALETSMNLQNAHLVKMKGEMNVIRNDLDAETKKVAGEQDLRLIRAKHAELKKAQEDYTIAESKIRAIQIAHTEKRIEKLKEELNSTHTTEDDMNKFALEYLNTQRKLTKLQERSTGATKEALSVLKTAQGLLDKAEREQKTKKENLQEVLTRKEVSFESEIGTPDIAALSHLKEMRAEMTQEASLFQTAAADLADAVASGLGGIVNSILEGANPRDALIQFGKYMEDMGVMIAMQGVVGLVVKTAKEKAQSNPLSLIAVGLGMVALGALLKKTKAKQSKGIGVIAEAAGFSGSSGGGGGGSGGGDSSFASTASRSAYGQGSTLKVEGVLVGDGRKLLGVIRQAERELGSSSATHDVL